MFMTVAFKANYLIVLFKLLTKKLMQGVTSKKSIFGLLRIATRKTWIWVTLKKSSQEGKESGAYKNKKKSHKVGKICLVNTVIDSDTRQQISVFKQS